MVPPEWFSGEIYIGVDPFPYFEKLAREPEAPALIYDWKIQRIEVETAPRILQDGAWIFDPDRRRLADVRTTYGGDEMILHCELLSGAPSKKLAYR
jgi:hypothetical protein